MLRKSILFSFIIIIGAIPCALNAGETNNVTSDYIGYLIIPKIDMNLGFYDIKDYRNTVEKNIEILPGSEEGRLFIAGHSGVGEKAYFNDLANLKIDDIAIIKYNNIDYNYVITDIHKEIKDGDIKVEQKTKEKILILTTCDQRKKGYQLVIKAVLQ